MVTIRLAEHNGLFTAYSTVDRATLESFGFFDDSSKEFRGSAQWKLDRTHLGLDSIVRFIRPVYA